MKTQRDPRHQRRREIVKLLFAQSFTPQPKMEGVVNEILAKAPELDEKIHNAASTWPIDKLNKIDLAILRLALYELETSQTPPKVIIDEAVELAKEFGSESSPSFINGVLGTIYNMELSFPKKVTA